MKPRGYVSPLERPIRKNNPNLEVEVKEPLKPQADVSPKRRP